MGSLIVLVIIILIGLFIKYISPYMHHYKLKIIISAYLTILLMSFLVSYQIPIANLSEAKVVTKSELKKVEKLEQEFNDLAHKGQLDKTEGVVINGPWSLEYTDNKINLEVQGNYSPMILVVRKPKDDGKIEVITYSNRTILDGVDFTHKIKPFKVLIDGNNLVLKAENNKFEFVRFTQDFSTAQFQGDGSKREPMYRNFFGQLVVYVHIPKSLKVNGNHENLNPEFIKEN